MEQQIKNPKLPNRITSNNHAFYVIIEGHLQSIFYVALLMTMCQQNMSPVDYKDSTEYPQEMKKIPNNVTGNVSFSTILFYNR